MQYNQLRDIPPALRNMTHIKRLNFASNLFDVTPGLLSHLTQVVQCNLTRNPLAKVRQAVAKRMKITKVRNGFFELAIYVFLNLAECNLPLPAAAYNPRDFTSKPPP